MFLRDTALLSVWSIYWVIDFALMENGNKDNAYNAQFLSLCIEVITTRICSIQVGLIVWDLPIKPTRQISIVKCRIYCLYFPFPCVYREKETPSSIPNLVVKLLFADDTASFRCGNVGRCRDKGDFKTYFYLYISLLLVTICRYFVFSFLYFICLFLACYFRFNCFYYLFLFFSVFFIFQLFVFIMCD